MARITIAPKWARYYDFGAGRFPTFLRRLVDLRPAEWFVSGSQRVDHREHARGDDPDADAVSVVARLP